MTKVFLKVVLLLFIPFLGFTQVSHSNHIHSSSCCVGGEMTPADRQGFAKTFLEWKKENDLTKRQARALPVRYSLLVVFHLIEGTPAITDAQVEVALASLNNAYSRSNDYGGAQDFTNAAGGADTQIEFCLAQKAPDGGVTTGITRTISDYSRFDQDLESNKLKTKLQWDPRHYVNIWVVSYIDSELNATFSGPTGWSRAVVGGYATLPGGVIGQNNFGDGVVVSGLGTGLLAHELGHYLGLLHTFSENGGCNNDDCTTEGDMVCDTPPDATKETYKACGGTQDNNSCTSDTLIFLPNGSRAPDLDDMFNNFMDYGNQACRDAFTQGQADRMHFHIENYRRDLYSQAPSNNNVCTPPCGGNVLIESIKKDVDYPQIGDNITFTSTATGVTNYEWYVEHLGSIESNYSIAMGTGYTPGSAPVATTPNLTHTFTTEGKHRVYLKAWNSANPTCFASSSAIITVTCGVDARFFPDKRLIASKQSINPRSEYLDSVLFTNRTYNGQTYNWTVEHIPFRSTDGPALPVFNATTEDLTHVFLEPGVYQISLEAINGACSNTSGPFNLTVEDPTMDGRVWILSTDCYKNDSIRTRLRVGNYGYDTVHVGMPISFYSGDPTLATSTYLSTFYVPEEVYGYDRTKIFTVIVPLDKNNPDELHVMFNDSGTVVPVVFPSAGERNKISTTITLPNTGLSELYYRNSADEEEIEFRTVLPEVTAKRCANETYDFDVSYRNSGDGRPGIRWVPNTNLSCTNCFDPTLDLGIHDVDQMILVTSEYDCVDTSVVHIEVVYDTAEVVSADTVCQNDASPTLSAVGNQLRWYTAATGGTSSSTPPVPSTQTIGTSSFWVSETTDGCEGPRVEIKSVVEGPPSSTITNPIELCVGDSVPDQYLENTVNSIGAILWYPNVTGRVGDSIVPTANTSAAGSYNLWVTVTGTNGCMSTRKQVTYEVKETKIQLAELAATRCANTTYTFDASISDPSASVTGIRWLPNTDLSCTNCLNPTLELGFEDVEQMLILTSEYGCVDTAVVQITVPYDTVSVTDADSVCVNDSPPTLPATGNQLLWYSNGTGGVGSSTAPIAETTTAGIFTYWVSETTDGCEGHRVSIASVVKPLPEIDIVNPAELCRGSEVPIGYLSDAVIGTGTLLWYANETGGVGVSETPLANAENVGTFDHWVTLTAENRCVSSKEKVTYSVKEIPSAPEVDGPVDVCINDNPPNLNNSIVSGTDILWYENIEQAVGAASPPTLVTDSVKTVNYWVTQTVNDCEGPMAELTYTIVDIEIKLDSTFEIDDGQSQGLHPEIILLPDTRQYTVEWLDEDGSVFSTDQSTTIRPILSANYVIEVSSNYGCLISDQVYVKVLGKLFPTHIFSPNGDGENDYWYIENLEDLSEVRVSIFNQWGRIVYTSNDYQSDWDGKSNGQLLPVGTYYYVIDLSKYEREELAGSITIIY